MSATPGWRFGFFMFIVLTAGHPVSAQTTPPRPSAVAAQTQAKEQIARWLEIQNATLNLRFRVVDNSAGVVTTKQLQHRESLRARLKADKSGRYALNLGVFTGSRFTSGWDNTTWGISPTQKNLAFKALYFAAQPVTGVEGQYGGLYLVKGESTEFTTYDDDGYVIGERISLRRRNQFYFDEISATVGYITGDIKEIAFSKRVKYLNDTPNYRQLLVDRRVNPRFAFSLDFTSALGGHTWRQAVNLKPRGLHVVDTVIFENYERTNLNKDYGFALTLDKALTKKVSVNWGFAVIDPHYGGLNADRFNIGKRAFVMPTYVFSPRFTASYFITTAVGHNVTLPQRTLMNLVISYNALTDLRRTGLF